jgi:hypothetical protein
MEWPDALEFAERAGGVLPSRIDMLVLFKNARSEFKSGWSDWYWTTEEVPGYADYAFIQNFAYGDQFSARKGNGSRARAVRRVPL